MNKKTASKRRNAPRWNWRWPQGLPNINFDDTTKQYLVNLGLSNDAIRRLEESSQIYLIESRDTSNMPRPSEVRAAIRKFKGDLEELSRTCNQLDDVSKLILGGEIVSQFESHLRTMATIASEALLADGYMSKKGSPSNSSWYMATAVHEILEYYGHPLARRGATSLRVKALAQILVFFGKPKGDSQKLIQDAVVRWNAGERYLSEWRLDLPMYIQPLCDEFREK